MSEMFNFEIYACGTEVIMKLGKVKGMITQVLIKGSTVMYEVSYYDDAYLEKWFYEYEFDVVDSFKQKVYKKKVKATN